MPEKKKEASSSLNKTPASKQELVAGRDYYIENGFLVFTEYFLKERGYCCGSGCRHCPYEKEAAS